MSAGYWSGSRTLDDRANLLVTRLDAKGDAQLAPVAAIHFEARVWNQDLLRGEQDTQGQMRELWLEIQPSESFDVRVGKQYMTWGRADGINPTDLINGNDLTALVVDDSDRKLGSWVLRATKQLGSSSVSALWLLNFVPSVIPLPPVGGGISLSREVPAAGLRQGAVKVERTGGYVDASLCYFDGFDHTPDMRLAGTAVTLFYPRLRVVGGDVAKNWGRFGLRAEGSFTFQGDADVTPFPPRQNVAAVVVGVDRSWFEYLNVNVQYLGRYLIHFEDPKAIGDPTVRSFAILRSLLIQQQARLQHGMSARVSYKWFHETLEAEVHGVTWFEGGDFVLSPRATYAINDNLKVSIGADIYRGPADSLFGLLRANSLGFGELGYSF
ncbi:MAG TPA: hypothetical protein VHM31_02565 [Polyangia bacterium]|nr:hypothetical protein [Polyangia bacterium]